MTAIQFVQWTGANTNTLASPLTTQVGDLVIVTSWAASATPPSLATGFTNLGTLNVGSTISGRMGYHFATGTSDSGGTWTNGTTTMGIAYRFALAPIGFSANSGTSNQPTWNPMPLSMLNATSWVYMVAVDLSQTVQGQGITGYTVRDSSTNGVVGSWDSNGGLTTEPGTRSFVTSGGSGTWITFQVEVPSYVPIHIYDQTTNRLSLY